MSERIGQDKLPGMEDRELLEAMTTDQLVDLVLEQGEKVSEIERTMNLAADVLEGYGTSMDAELQKREQKNGTT